MEKRHPSLLIHYQTIENESLFFEGREGTVLFVERVGCRIEECQTMLVVFRQVRRWRNSAAKEETEMRFHISDARRRHQSVAGVGSQVETSSSAIE